MGGVSLVIAKGQPDGSARVAVEVDGHSFVVEPGATRLVADHPLVRARPDLFEPVVGETPKRGRRAK